MLANVAIGADTQIAKVIRQHFCSAEEVRLQGVPDHSTPPVCFALGDDFATTATGAGLERWLKNVCTLLGVAKQTTARNSCVTLYTPLARPAVHRPACSAYGEEEAEVLAMKM